MKKSVIPEVKLKLDEDGNPVLTKDGQHLLESPIMFVSEYRGLQVLDGSPEPVCRFTPFAVLHPTYGQISKGHYLCLTKEIFDRLIKHDSFDKSFRIVKRLPRETDRRGMIINRDISDGNKKSLHELNDEERALYRELVHLEAQYFTQDSGYTTFKDTIRKDDTKNSIIGRMSAIKSKLNLRED